MVSGSRKAQALSEREAFVKSCAKKWNVTPYSLPESCQTKTKVGRVIFRHLAKEARDDRKKTLRCGSAHRKRQTQSTQSWAIPLHRRQKPTQ